MQEMSWFVMSATFRGEIKMKQVLEELGVTCYVPLLHKLKKTRSGIYNRVVEPAIANMIFVYASRNVIQQVKTQFPRLQYHTCRENGRNVPIVVPTKQMESFIKATRVEDHNLSYLSVDEIDLKKGTRVAVVGGPLDGVEGIFVKVKGCRAKKIVIQLQGISIAPAIEVAPDFIKVLD